MSDTCGAAVRLTLFGESHGPAIGAVLEGIAPGTPIDEAAVAAAMDRRRAKGDLSTARREADKVEFLSGVYRGRATGTALTLVIQNTNVRSGDYDDTAALPRPGHADYTGLVRYQGFADPHGGGHFSGRLTAPLVAAGAICEGMLAHVGVRLGTRLACCGGAADAGAFQFADAAALAAQLDGLKTAPFPALDEASAQNMQAAIRAAAGEGDSVGGVLETVVAGLPAGVGDPFFDSVESVLSHLLFSIPAVKGVEFGDGFAMAQMRGSAANDPLRMRGGRIVTATNHNGGINGGITNGMPVVLRTAVKPTPSIYKQQDTVDLSTRENARLAIHGRHDPCIAHRARAVQDALVALGLADLLARRWGPNWTEADVWTAG